MFIAALQRHLHTHVYCSTIHNSQIMETAKMPSTDEWIKKLWYLSTMEFYAAMKKNKMLSFAGKWMELEDIILSEVSMAQKTKNHMFSLICGQ
jgi:CDP-diacylglycerol pyrophosphatase